MTSRAALRVRYARGKMTRILLGGVLLIAASLFLAFSSEPPWPIRGFGAFSAVFFGSMVAIGLFWMGRSAEDVVVVDDVGVFDRRLGGQPIPWAAIEDVRLASMHRQSFILIDVAPEAERRLELTAMTRWTRGGNRALGYDGLCIAATGLAIAPLALFQAIRAGRDAATGGNSPSQA